MPKIKVPRKSTNIDMTAMCDVSFLLLTFFMLTTKFKADEPVIVQTPKSISEIKLPDNDIMSITVTKEGKVFYGVDGKFNREKLLQKISSKYNISFTEEEQYAFSLTTAFGVPITKLKTFLDMSAEDRKNAVQPGIPIDSTNNELGVWIINGRLANPNYRIAIRGDGDCPYPVIKQVIATLQSWHVNKFNLITNLEVRPKI
ncbi:MAG: biopolymer transporter ExbD [Ignavibacteriaceae bacterium]|nr:biopolymer transporter ExbD [Ignavibacteriaceae bacterium]